MGEENLMCPICGGLHPAGHRDKELEEKLEAVKKHYDDRPKVVHAPLWFMKLGKILEGEV